MHGSFVVAKTTVMLPGPMSTRKCPSGFPEPQPYSSLYWNGKGGRFNPRTHIGMLGCLICPGADLRADLIIWCPLQSTTCRRRSKIAATHWRILCTPVGL